MFSVAINSLSFNGAVPVPTVQRAVAPLMQEAVAVPEPPPPPPKIQTLLGDLQAQLGQVVRQGDESEGDKSIESCQGILTPADEIQFWATYSGRTIDIDMVRGVNDAFDTDRGKWSDDVQALCSEQQKGGAAAGAMAGGVVEAGALQPLDVIKTRLQLGGASASGGRFGGGGKRGTPLSSPFSSRSCLATRRRRPGQPMYKTASRKPTATCEWALRSATRLFQIRSLSGRTRRRVTRPW